MGKDKYDYYGAGDIDAEAAEMDRVWRSSLLIKLPDLLDPSSPQEWKRDSLCSDPIFKEMTVDWFADSPKAIETAKRVCMGCPVRLDCLDFALRNKEEFGVWGGTSASQRINARKQGIDIMAIETERDEATEIEALEV